MSRDDHLASTAALSNFMLLRIVSFIPAAWAIFIAFLLDHLNQDPHKADLGPGSPRVLELGMVVLNLLIAVPIRGVRLTATLVLFALVTITFFEIGAWWLPGLIVAIIVTVADWTRRRRVAQESEQNPAPH
jgi:hypothetical protein